MAKTRGDARPDYVVLLNRSSGDDEDTPEPEAIERAFAERGGSARVVALAAGDDLPGRIREAIESGAGCVVAAGGDGTICAVAEALSGTDIDLGIIPQGTFNYFARRFGISTDLGAAIDVIARGRSAPIDLGSINGRVFLNNASLGLYASILRERESVYNRWGRSQLAAYWSVIVAMATVYRPLTMRISVDGEVRGARTPMVFVAMSAYQLDEFGIEGADAIRDGKFAVLVAPDVGRFRLVWKALRIALRGIRRGRDFTLLTGEKVRIETRRSVRLVARDGERERMEGPFELRMLRGAVRLRIPGAATEEDTAA